MVDNSDQIKKRFITEGDIASLLQRYDATTMLKLLQEVAYSAGPRIDWDTLVKNTSTGITNAREYQMLWRHLAYGDSLLPVEDDAQPLDDDSDLDCEVEASPHVSNEASMEANAHVKVMAASYFPAESNISDNSTVEAPLTINIPNGLSYKSYQETSESPWSSRGINITFPVSLQKAPSSEALNGNGSAIGNMASRKKRKKWSPGEDAELIAAVKRCGEGNWAHILRGEFKGERTASQLSQRWALIRKRCDTSSSAVNQTGLQRTEAQMAANHALSLAVGNRAPAKKLSVGVSPMASCGSTVEAPAVGASSSQGQPQSQLSVVQALPRAVASVPAAKSRVATVKKTANSTSRTDLVVTANSVAAAACMAGPSTAAACMTGPSTAAACMAGTSTAASVSKTEPGKNAAELVPKPEPGKPASAACMPRSSVGISLPKAEPGKSIAPSPSAATKAQAVALPTPRHVANGNLNHVTVSSPPVKSPFIAPRTEGPVIRTIQHVSTSSASAPKVASEHRMSAASVFPALVPSKPNVAKMAETGPRKMEGGQRMQTQGNGAGISIASQQKKTVSTKPEINAEKQVIGTKTVDVLLKNSTAVQTGVGVNGKGTLKNPPEKESKTTVAHHNGAVSKTTTISPINGAERKTTLSPINGTDDRSKAKDKVNNNENGNGSKSLEVANTAKNGSLV